MDGFKKFLLQGNVIELAVAVVIATVFAKVVDAFVTIIMDLIGKAGGTPDFSSYMPGGVHVGTFLTALVGFIIVAAVVYFAVVKPYEAFKARTVKPVEEGATELGVLTEIRDALRAGR
ncbi:MscL family protein [Calidifontibacter terrae]